MNKTSRIYVAGHNGMVGSAIVRKLKEEGFEHIIVRSSSECDLETKLKSNNFFPLRNLGMYFLLQLKSEEF